MNAERRLAELLNALDELGAKYLVMGGDAARYYGVERNTVDYGLHLSVDDRDGLELFLRRSAHLAWMPLVEGPSWRPNDFRRFMIGKLADGREEWFECWRHNHLLTPFAEGYRRREEGEYGGQPVPFLSLLDLIRSKETERESDRQDIALLEEIHDARQLALDQSGANPQALIHLRSRKGFERAVQQGRLSDRLAVQNAFQVASCPITRAILAPVVGLDAVSPDVGMIGEVVNGSLRQAELGPPRHLALVEAVRRLYKKSAMESDRADKMKSLSR